CSGGVPLAITNCLNFGNPYNPEVYWQFVGAIKGMSNACKKFHTPVTGGNVSFYNQCQVGKNIEAVHPTPTIGMIGLLDKKQQMGLAFEKKGDSIYMLGYAKEDINCSEYLYNYKGVKLSPAPYMDLDEEFDVHQAVLGLINEKIISSAHDISDGGLIITLLESAMVNNLGFDILTDSEYRIDSYLFGEAQGRIVVSIDPNVEAEFIDLMMATGVPAVYLGHITQGRISVDDEDFGKIEEYKKLYNDAIGKKMA
ncbi:MAG: AIR synthase related protein, partial [Bacteroidales bacterium]